MSDPIVAVTGLNRGENPQAGYAVVRSLRRRFPRMTIIGMIYDAMESGIFADDGPDWAYLIPYPSSGAKAFLDRLDVILKKHPIEILIPTLDTEIEMLIRLEPELTARGIRSFLPTLESFRASGKPVLDKLCESCGCATPRSELVSDLTDAERAAEVLGYPLMVKGSFYDAKLVHDEGELGKAFGEILRKWGAPLLIQKRIRGGEFNVLGVGDGHGGVTGLCTVRKTIVSSQGKGISSVVLREPRLEAIALRIVERLKWRGPFELELMHDEEDDTFRIIELNPRFPAWVDFPSAFGLNFPAQIVALLMGEKVELAIEVPVGRFFIRHQIELIGSVEDLEHLMTEGVRQAQRSRS